MSRFRSLCALICVAVVFVLTITATCIFATYMAKSETTIVKNVFGLLSSVTCLLLIPEIFVFVNFYSDYMMAKKYGHLLTAAEEEEEGDDEED